MKKKATIFRWCQLFTQQHFALHIFTVFPFKLLWCRVSLIELLQAKCAVPSFHRQSPLSRTSLKEVTIRLPGSQQFHGHQTSKTSSKDGCIHPESRRNPQQGRSDLCTPGRAQGQHLQQGWLWGALCLTPGGHSNAL